jgi:hypothetical protein
MDTLKEVIIVSSIVEDNLYAHMQMPQIIQVRVRYEPLQEISSNNDDKRKAFYEKKLARLKLIQDICK